MAAHTLLSQNPLLQPRVLEVFAPSPAQGQGKAQLQDGKKDEFKSWMVSLCHWRAQGNLQSTLGMQESLGGCCGGWAASSAAQEPEEPGNLLSIFSCQPFMFVFLRSFCSLGKSDSNSC